MLIISPGWMSAEWQTVKVPGPSWVHQIMQGTHLWGIHRETTLHFSPTCPSPGPLQFRYEDRAGRVLSNSKCSVLLSQIQEMVHSEVAAYDSGRPGPLLGRPAMLASHMSALSQSQLISQMGIRSGIAHSSPSPPGSKSATPSPSSSTQEEESEAHFKVGRVAMQSLGMPSRQQEDGPCMETGITYQ